MKLALGLLTIVFGSLLAVAMLFTAGWERPPMEVTQTGYRGLELGQITNPRTEAVKKALNTAPAPLYEASATGERAATAFQNVKVLGDLSVDQFNLMMASITEWVAPNKGCAHCHNEDNLASDEKYTKVVSRRMLEMTRQINSEWSDHVKATGVTCYTCHRGQNVPSETWVMNTGPKQAGGMAAHRNGQNLASKNVGTTSLPFDPYTRFLKGQAQIAVNSTSALPYGSDRTIQDAEQTYGLMMHFAQSLGVNCTHCHNSRAFWDWEQSPPTRLQAQAGISMVQALNNDYLEPLGAIVPASRKGPQGDPMKANCATCHHGVNKPMYGAPMVKDYPSLVAAK